ncbi:hypothetical protein D8878_04085 [Streptococcus sanguinis]|uniref:Uncharacterized protein n=1 Tax=Streptococcus sanguinis TaxID=1305 RepID=A0AB74DJS3_STRSA|nr:hypothetical protein D8879_05820 [Streptococcus sanguinis]RSI37035.1 hypothetical protein D8878_04085 [Streptococcus sanguinis]
MDHLELQALATELAFGAIRNALSSQTQRYATRQL